MVYIGWLLGGVLLLGFIICISKLRVFINYYHQKGNTDVWLRFELWNGLFAYKVNIPIIKLLTHHGKKRPIILFERDTKTKDGTQTKKAVKDEITYSDVERTITNAKKLIRQVESLQAVVRSFLKKIEIRDVCWHTEIGMKDAAWTGIAAGSIWSVKGASVSAVSHVMRLTNMPELMVTPVFGQPVWRTEFSCMISLRPGHAIVAVIKILSRFRGRNSKWKAMSAQ
ncbi:DUF2953 domain-containing protein [Bacillus xiapuensis]|uniref:DUF2953 domain-containing protein n=1 Tax=Bacillus xiapuensis TaxID=2014075 RepID=UPI000C23CC80|nr:DUF2953 domain-containing protein [Bacillus xiapuensis]